MSRKTIYNLRGMGVSQDDIEIAKATQAAQRRNGSPVQTLGAICGVVTQPRQNAPVSLTDRAMRKRGTYDQAALLFDQQALQENSPERAAKARLAAQIGKELSSSAQLEFDFFGGGNVSISFQYGFAVSRRLKETGKPISEINRAKAVVWEIVQNLGWQTYECSKTAGDLAEATGIDKADMSRTLQLLESVGAIKRVQCGRGKVITVTPEGAFRGNIHHHAESVERYKLDVIDGGLKP